MAKKITETQIEIRLSTEKVFCNACGKELNDFEKATDTMHPGHEMTGLCSACKDIYVEKKHGGARPGAGRKKKADKKQVKSFTLEPETVDTLSHFAKKQGWSLSEAVNWLIQVHCQTVAPRDSFSFLDDRETDTLNELAERNGTDPATVIRMALWDFALEEEVEDGPCSRLSGPEWFEKK